MEAIQEELDKMAAASDRLEMLETYFEDDPYGIIDKICNLLQTDT